MEETSNGRVSGAPCRMDSGAFTECMGMRVSGREVECIVRDIQNERRSVEHWQTRGKASEAHMSTTTSGESKETGPPTHVAVIAGPVSDAHQFRAAAAGITLQNAELAPDSGAVKLS